MLEIGSLPHLNAGLNALSALLLLLGWLAIRRRRVALHRALMVAATVVSTAFLASYLTYHAAVGSVRFTHPGPVRVFYLGLLLVHTVLAAAVPPLVIASLWAALAGRFARHRRVARITWPVWMTVSVTGVMVYLMLYHLYPPGT